MKKGMCVDEGGEPGTPIAVEGEGCQGGEWGGLGGFEEAAQIVDAHAVDGLCVGGGGGEGEGGGGRIKGFVAEESGASAAEEEAGGGVDAATPAAVVAGDKGGGAALGGALEVGHGGG